MDDQVALAVHGRGIPVNQNQVFIAELANQTVSRVDGKTGAGDDQQVRF